MEGGKSQFFFQIHPKRTVNAEPDGHHANAFDDQCKSKDIQQCGQQRPQRIGTDHITDNELIVNGSISHKEHGEETG